MNGHSGQATEQKTEAKSVKAAKGVPRPDDAVAVPVKEGTVLLQNGLARVSRCPIVFGGAVGMGSGGGDIGSRGPRILQELARSWSEGFAFDGDRFIRDRSLKL